MAAGLIDSVPLEIYCVDRRLRFKEANSLVTATLQPTSSTNRCRQRRASRISSAKVDAASTKLQTAKTWRWRSRKYFRKRVIKKRKCRGVSTWLGARWNKIRGGWEVLAGAGRSRVKSAVYLFYHDAGKTWHTSLVWRKICAFSQALVHSSLHFSREPTAKCSPGSRTC